MRSASRPNKNPADNDEADNDALADPAPVAVDLVPGFRDRLVVELDAANVSPRHRITEICRMSGRARPSVSRWLDAEEPGLPDLESFTRLCMGLRVDANYMLGLVQPRLHLPGSSSAGQDEAWLEEVKRTAARSLADCIPVVMRGDDMAPKIKDGDVMFVDRRVMAVEGNGVYLLEWRGRTIVRVIEDRLEQGLVLRCANSQYGEANLPLSELDSGRLRIAGRVTHALALVPMY